MLYSNGVHWLVLVPIVVLGQPTSISPTSISNGWATSITLSGFTSGVGDTAEFAASCPGAGGTATGTETTVPSSTTNPTVTFTVTAGAGTYTLCYNKVDLLISLTVVAATSASAITRINPFTWRAGVPTEVTLTGAALGDLAIFATSCTNAVPSIAITLPVTIFTLTSSGYFKLCYRQSGGSDSVEQRSADTVIISPSATSGNDPVARFGDRVLEFSLPPQQLHTLLHTPDMAVEGSTFEGGGSYEQWFGRMVLSSSTGAWLDISIKPNLDTLNRSKVDRLLGFETLDVIVGQGEFDKPRVVSIVPGLDAKIPFEVFGWQVGFRTIKRRSSIRFSSIGFFHRECVDIGGAYLHLYICSSPATEYYGHQRDLSLKYAHLDLAVVEVRELQHCGGLLPELWGLRPPSPATAALVAAKDLLKLNSSNASFNQNTMSATIGWAGGLDVDRIQADIVKSTITDVSV